MKNSGRSNSDSFEKAVKPRDPAKTITAKETKDRAARFMVDAQGTMRYSGEIASSVVTEETELATVLLDQITGSLPFAKKGAHDTMSLNFASQAMHSLKLKDGLEALLGTQLVATHSLGMEFLKRAALPEQTAAGVDLNVNRATRLLRAFATVAETLRGHRNGDGQKVTVEHVHIHKGGQAIVGAVSHGDSGGREGQKRYGG